MVVNGLISLNYHYCFYVIDRIFEVIKVNCKLTSKDELYFRIPSEVNSGVLLNNCSENLARITGKHL